MLRASSKRFGFDLAARLLLGGLCWLATAVAYAQTAPSQYGPVLSGEGLAQIAKNLAPQLGVDSGELMRALYAANPEDFVGGDINHIRLGATLTIPAGADIPRLAQAGQTRLAQKKARPTGSTRRVAPLQTPAPAQPPAELAVVPAPVVQSGRPEPEPIQPFVPPAVVAAPVPARPAPIDAEQLRRGAFVETPEYQICLSLLRAGAAQDAYAALVVLEDGYAGDADFDYLYGVAALDSGRHPEALFPLQRAVESRPGNLGARVDLGRAFFEVGDNEAARREFETLRAMNPPPKAAQVIESYLSAIHRRAVKYRTRWTGSLGLLAGVDSNANTATDAQVFQDFELETQSRSTESSYYGGQGAAGLSYPLFPRWRLELAGNVQNREYPDAPFVDFRQYGASAGARYERAGLSWQISLAASQLDLDGEDNNTVSSLTSGVSLSLGQRWQAGTNLRYAQVRYADAISVRDVDQLLLALVGTRSLQLLRGGQLTLGALFGLDEAVEAGSPNGRDVLGANLGLLLSLSPRWQATAGAALMAASYDGPFFGQSQRDDVQYSTELGLNFADNRLKSWVFRGSVKYLRNDSDIELFEYDRLDAGISARRFFE